MIRLAFALFALTTCLPCSGDEPELSEKAKLANRVAKLVIENWKLDVTAATAGVIESDLPEMVRAKLEAHAAEFKNNFDWGKVEAFVAEDYASRYNRDELGEMLEFGSSATGRKFLAAQAEIKANVLRQVALASLVLPLQQQTKANVAMIIESVDEPSRKLLQDALRSPKVSPELVAGTWYSDEMDDEGNGYRGRHEKRLSGSHTSHGVDINHEMKEYMAFDDEGVWLLQGRLLAETNFEFRDDTQLFILESVTADEMKYRYVDPDSDASEWPLIIDTRTPVDFPEKPIGYRDPYQ